MYRDSCRYTVPSRRVGLYDLCVQNNISGYNAGAVLSHTITDVRLLQSSARGTSRHYTTQLIAGSFLFRLAIKSAVYARSDLKCQNSLC